tara:strand:- start:297 stop:1226 length:930 start_codon:yes stop_codon:yes gene_type:complete
MNKKIILKLLLIFLIFSNDVRSIENKIIMKINNEIITSLDLINEIEYLKALNKKILSLEDKKIIEISKKSLIKEKIKKIEILKIIDEIYIEDDYLDKLIENTYSRLNISSRKEFNEYIKKRNIDIELIKKKLSIEALWNQIIYTKFNQNVKIDQNTLQRQILENKNTKLKSYLLSEIIFNLEKDENYNNKYNKITKSIEDKGFDNTALIYSIADSSKISGNIGWFEENKINQKIKNELKKIDKGNYTKPILIPGGFIILKIQDIREKTREIDLETEYKKLLNIETNRQLNDYSNIYFNKVKKDIKFDEL